QITLLLQGRSDHPLLHYATLSLYDRLLSAGVQIFEYEQALLHAKVAVIDEDWATVGSSNIDPFSLLLAREANIVVRDRMFAETLRTRLWTAIRAEGREVRAEDQRRRSWLERVASSIAYSLVRLLIGVTRYGAVKRYGARKR
ncbi:MAG: cardiolipin synthase ClsB, partial [Sulfuritalea sp.]|nr:cardiolipin synthase ClsB [Sulfuritalea sp.]